MAHEPPLSLTLPTPRRSVPNKAANMFPWAIQ